MNHLEISLQHDISVCCSQIVERVIQLVLVSLGALVSFGLLYSQPIIHHLFFSNIRSSQKCNNRYAVRKGPYKFTAKTNSF